MNLLEVRGLSKSFGSNTVLNNVDLTVKSGERIAIIGSSGCGKSVFLRSLLLLEKPDAGTVLIDGKEITAPGADIDTIRRSSGMVFQQFHLFSEMNVMDNLCLAPVRLKRLSHKDAEAKARDLLSQVGLLKQAHAMPSILSGGQQQRIAICRCLMMDPKILLFDEPTSALDPTMVGEVLAVIRMLAKRNMSMLIVTHEMNFAAEVADRVLFFADGGIYEEGTPAEIFDHPTRDKTKAFIQKIKYFSYDINSPDFDLPQLQGGIRLFGDKYGIPSKEVYRLQICCEELIYELLAHCFRGGDVVDMHLDVTFSEVDQRAQIVLSCNGRKYDPFSGHNDGLGVTIIKNVAKEYHYLFKDCCNFVNIFM